MRTPASGRSQVPFLRAPRFQADNFRRFVPQFHVGRPRPGKRPALFRGINSCPYAFDARQYGPAARHRQQTCLSAGAAGYGDEGIHFPAGTTPTNCLSSWRSSSAPVSPAPSEASTNNLQWAFPSPRSLPASSRRRYSCSASNCSSRAFTMLAFATRRVISGVDPFLGRTQQSGDLLRAAAGKRFSAGLFLFTQVFPVFPKPT